MPSTSVLGRSKNFRIISSRLSSGSAASGSVLVISSSMNWHSNAAGHQPCQPDPVTGTGDSLTSLRVNGTLPLWIQTRSAPFKGQSGFGNLAGCRLNVTYLATAQIASTQKAWPRPDDGQLVLALFGTETPCNGLSPSDRIMFFAAAIGGRLYGKEQTQADA